MIHAIEAAIALLAYLFNDLGKYRVVATTDTRNVASYSVLEKLGFSREAHFVQNIFFKGAWSDEYQYAHLSAEPKLIK
ncbi:GNAT family protein [Vibrio breoganii]|uniref:GNAT family N-acetyltransferase n=1 Tax=Vibrio breoganii TaxID=553239 RepID=UPI00030A1C0A|nr:GNAT family protein [Vibrio breoganii]